MRATQLIHDGGRSIWLDNISRNLLTSGTLHSEGAESFDQSWNEDGVSASKNFVLAGKA